MNIQREQLIQTWLTDVFCSDQFKIKYLAGDASFRRYARVYFQKKTFILMDAPPEQEDCAPFVRIDEFLDSHGVRVPHIRAKDLLNGLLLLEDFGDVVLAQRLSTPTVEQYYQQCFKQLVALQAIDASANLPAYSYAKLTAEMQLFNDWLLPSLDITLSEMDARVLKDTFTQLANSALAQPQVIVHRDFHSRNLMLLDGESDLGVIDFQDAVIGADTYDLISLVRDAYVQWPVAQVDAWITSFYAQLPQPQKQARDVAQFKKEADLMSLQRHIKILGIFVRLFERDGKKNYLKDLPLVMWYVLEQSQRYTETNAFYQLLTQQVMPRFEEKYGIYYLKEAIS